MKGHALRVGFHWVTVLLITATFAIAFARGAIEDADSRLFWLDVHRSVGLAILAIAVLRLIARLTVRFEKVHESGPLMRLAAGATHIALYAGLLAMPLLGWAQSSAKMRKFKIFGVKLPALVDHDSDLGDKLGEWHEALAWAILALIALHVVAALYHHFFRRDGVLTNMLRFRPVLAED